MQPWQHARTSSKLRNANWVEDLAIHEFIDSAKASCPSLKHRMILHNRDLGPFLAKRLFPDNAHIDEIFEIHVKQDIGSYPSITEWLATARRPIRFKWLAPDDEGVIRQAKLKAGMESDHLVRQVYDLLTCASNFITNDEALARQLLMNSFGPSLVRMIFGPAKEIKQDNGQSVFFDPSWTAEGIIVANFGCIESLEKVLNPFDGLIKGNQRGAA